ncbi:MAG: flagellar basal body L-ring protein FlgH [Candidatus Melainabacteria bacterium]|nr:flagellar basal body L-ring protein FlgH [Candidatus Melainabacteria bacterium]
MALTRLSSQQLKPTQPIRIYNRTLLAISIAVLSAAVFVMQTSQAESLFQARASYTNPSGQPVFTPRSLFVQPRPQQVGDIVTILVNEATTQQINANVSLTKEQQINETGSTVFNNVVDTVVGKFTGGRINNKISNFLRLPSLTGVDNTNEMTSRNQLNTVSALKDNVSCQVVQVLPNGHLVIQGHKSTMMNKERTDYYVTGVINPYYLDQQNQIASSQVANLQFHIGGRGVLSRQQNDGVLTKIYQYLQ